MAISWTSEEQACAFGEAEVPNLNNFEAISRAARAKWNDVLGTIKVDTRGVNRDDLIHFWSSLYRVHISPFNLTGDNPLWQSS
jgi:putative alpha-1,2-mannosidase